MPFISDSSWSPSTYRAALDAWRAQAPANDSAVLPRKAAPTSTPRHGDLAGKLRSLLTWRALSNDADWTLAADNDNTNNESVEATAPPLLDSTYEIRPRPTEIMAAIKEVRIEERRHAKLGGGGELHVVPVGGDMERGPVWGQRGKPPCIVRLGEVRFSNGGHEERAPVRNAADKIQSGWVRIPLGGLVDCGGFQRDRFRGPKGARQEGPEPTVGVGGASSGAMAFEDPVDANEDAARIRSAVKPETAEVLDLSLRSANFRDIGEYLGHRGKHAERRGKAALIAACAELDSVLAA